MTFTENPSTDLESPTGTPRKTINTISEKLTEASQRNSILQVPSLSSHPPTVETVLKPSEQRWREEQEIKHLTYPMGGWPLHHSEAPVFVNYRTGDIAFAEGWQYYPGSESPPGMRHLSGGIPRFESHPLPQRFHLGPRGLHHQPSPRLQSGRGAARLSVPVRASAREAEPILKKSSFPVSNRGKGRRSPACRIQLPSSEAPRKSDNPEDEQEQREETKSSVEQRVGEAVAERVVQAMAKKTNKRKLPLSSKSSAGASAKPAEEASSKPSIEASAKPVIETSAKPPIETKEDNDEEQEEEEEGEIPEGTAVGV